MTADSAEGWKIFPDKGDFENVPLWRALALFRSSNLDEGLRVNSTVIENIRKAQLRAYDIAFVANIILVGFAIFSTVALTLSIKAGLFLAAIPLLLIVFVICATPNTWRHIYQYGWKSPDDTLGLPHGADQVFDEFLNYLQNEDGPKAYYFLPLNKSPQCLNRRHFFGRLRYFLFSERGRDRRIVMRWWIPMPSPADIYLNRGDVERMVAEARALHVETLQSDIPPKGESNSGRTRSDKYAEALVARIFDWELTRIDLGNEATAKAQIRKRLQIEYDAELSRSDWEPSDEQAGRDMDRIYRHLKILRDSGRMRPPPDFS